MAVSNASRLAEEFDTEIGDLLSIARGGSGGPTARRAARERLLESVFLNAVTAMEAFLERLFFKAVTGRIRTGNVRAVMRFSDESVAWRMVLPPRDRYLTWLSIDDTLARAHAFLIDGLPFSRLERRVLLKSRLNEAMILRNMVAHRSDYARERFRNLVGGRYSTSGEYLDASSGRARVCDAFLADFVRIANGLCADADLSATAILGAKDPFRSRAKVGAGQYCCIGCGTVTTVAVGATAGLACPTCDPPCHTCGRTPSTASFTEL